MPPPCPPPNDVPGSVLKQWRSLIMQGWRSVKCGIVKNMIHKLTIQFQANKTTVKPICTRNLHIVFSSLIPRSHSPPNNMHCLKRMVSFLLNHRPNCRLLGYVKTRHRPIKNRTWGSSIHSTVRGVAWQGNAREHYDNAKLTIGL